MKQQSITFKPIGIIRTSYRTKYGAPRQPATASIKSVGTIILHEGKNFEQSLEDLAGFDYIWILFWFHKNANWKPKVLPPHGDRKKRGLFATRSPHRPNPIGLSLCKLIAVKGRRIKIENPDMLDGTPILDIKPYIPHAEALPDARGGWIKDAYERIHSTYRVMFAPEIKPKLDKMEKEHSEIVTYLNDVLSRDPYPHVYRRIKIQKDGSSVIAVKRWRFSFKITGSEVHVINISHEQDK